MSLETRIVHNAADAIIAADASGKIRLWNAGAEQLFGFSAAEAQDQSLDIIIPEAQRQRHWGGYEHVMQTGLTKYGSRLLRVPAVRKDGRRISIAFTVGLLKDAAGSVEESSLSCAMIPSAGRLKRTCGGVLPTSNRESQMIPALDEIDGPGGSVISFVPG